MCPEDFGLDFIQTDMPCFIGTQLDSAGVCQLVAGLYGCALLGMPVDGAYCL